MTDVSAYARDTGAVPVPSVIRGRAILAPSFFDIDSRCAIIETCMAFVVCMVCLSAVDFPASNQPSLRGSLAAHQALPPCGGRSDHGTIPRLH